MRIIGDRFPATSPFRWAESAALGLHLLTADSSAGLHLKHSHPFPTQNWLVPDTTRQLPQYPHVFWKYLPDVSSSPTNSGQPQTCSQRNFKLLLCSIPNPGIASSLPPTTSCTCASPFSAGPATEVFKTKIFKNKTKKVTFLLLPW